MEEKDGLVQGVGRAIRGAGIIATLAAIALHTGILYLSWDVLEGLWPKRSPEPYYVVLLFAVLALATGFVCLGLLRALLQKWLVALFILGLLGTVALGTTFVYLLGEYTDPPLPAPGAQPTEREKWIFTPELLADRAKHPDWDLDRLRKHVGRNVNRRFTREYRHYVRWCLGAWCAGGVIAACISVNSLYLLYSKWAAERAVKQPKEQLFRISTQTRQPRLHVVFLHGLMGNYLETWRAGEFSWPHSIAEGHPDLAVWSMNYNVGVSRWTGKTMPLVDRAANILFQLSAQRIFERPILFIVHSYGGLVAKKMWKLIHDRGDLEQAQHAIAGIVFLATPHVGSGLAKVLKMLVLARPTVTIGDLMYGAPNLRELNDWYINHPIPRNLVFFETQKTGSFFGFGVMVVDEVSANPSLKGVHPVPVAANHISICKPTSKDDPLVLTVNRLIQELLAVADSDS